MKKTLKIVLPIVLVLLLLGGTVWFFSAVRPDLITGLFLSQASSMAERGRYHRAVTYYSWALALEPERSDIPILLADTYAQDGNFTKAEYTLVKAISANPGQTQLYTALSRIYVQQDKLLDAVQMLDRTTDASVKAELDSLRPAAPILSPVSGYYTDYIEVTAESSGNTVFLTTDGEYPSTDQDIYSAPVSLPAGETTVLAVAVNDSGLVSPVVLGGYTVGGVVEAVTLADPAVDEAVRAQLGLSADEPLMSDLLWSITNLTLPETVENLSDLVYFTGLKTLTVQNKSGLDFSPLQQIPALQELDLSGCTISSNGLHAIGSLLELRKLVLNGCALTDISAFAQLTKLTELRLGSNSISDLGVLSLMLDLELVDVSNNPLSSIAALSTCSKLRDVDISNCGIRTLGSLAGKQDLEILHASGNNLKSLDDLLSCEKLSILEFASNQVEDISILAKLPALVQVDAGRNAITEVPKFDSENSKLLSIRLDYNQIEDISGLAGVDTLNYVYADYNKIQDLTPLKDNRNLVQINVWDNPVSEDSIAALLESSIIVNYNPNYEAPAEEESQEG